MIDLAVANRQETFERMARPLQERGIRVGHVPTTERTIAITGPNATIGGFDAGFVFPGRMMEGAVIASLLSVPWLNDRDAVLTSRNKARVIADLDRTGVPVPRTVMVSNPVDASELRRVFDRFDPPVVVKPNSTTRGIGVAKAHDLDTFLGICDYLDLVHDYRATGDKAFLVQEYLSEARDYRVMVLEGEYVGAVERRLPVDRRNAGHWKHNVHRGAVADGIEADSTLRDLAERTAATLGITFLGVDILETEDRLVVNETNARPTIDEVTKYESGFYDKLATAIEDLLD